MPKPGLKPLPTEVMNAIDTAVLAMDLRSGVSPEKECFMRIRSEYGGSMANAWVLLREIQERYDSVAPVTLKEQFHAAINKAE